MRPGREGRRANGANSCRGKGDTSQTNRRYPQAGREKAEAQSIRHANQAGKGRKAGRGCKQAVKEKSGHGAGKNRAYPGRTRKAFRQKMLRFPEKEATLLPETGNALPENMLRFFQKHAALFGKSGRGIRKKSLGKRGIPQGLSYRSATKCFSARRRATDVAHAGGR